VTLVIAWAKDSRSVHVAQFVRAAAEVAANGNSISPALNNNGK
jgi:hypothetical protein